MRAHAASLSLDIIDMILACSPDYATLTSAAIVCQTFYRAFQGRAAGILHDVAMHLYRGREELIWEAIRTIRIETNVRYLNRWASCDQARFPSVLAAQFHDQAFQQRPLTRNEAKELCKRVDDACALEVVFSLRQKDQRTRTRSRLNDEQSLNFHYALHRLEVVLFLSRWRHAGASYWESRAYRYALYYRHFSTEAIFHMYEVYTFLKTCVVEASRHKWHPRHPDIHLYRSERPQFATMNIGTTRVMSVIRNPRTHKFRFRAGVLLCESQLVECLWPDTYARESIPEGVRRIVSKTKGPNLRCQNCRLRSGGALWNSSNWHDLPEYFRLDKLCDFLPERAAHNDCERSQLMEFLHIVGDNSALHSNERVQGSTTAFEEILTALFKMASPTSPAVPLETRMCARCLDDIIAERFWRWWAQVKGEKQTDCRYGFDCKTQSHRPGHAMTYNHICPNTALAHRALKTAVGDALRSGRSCHRAGDAIDDEFLKDLMWRAEFDFKNVCKMRKEDVEERYGQQLRLALQKYQDMFYTKQTKLWNAIQLSSTSQDLCASL